MKARKLSIFLLSVHNLSQRPFRTVCLVMIVAILAITLFGGSILTSSLQKGMQSMKDRLGADLMIVPEGYQGDAQSILIQGEPNYFYFNQSVSDEVAKIEGISQITTQFFLTSLSEECCSSRVQLIAFDPETDFVIQPWIEKAYGHHFGDGQLIAGSKIVLLEDNRIKLYQRYYPVAAQLGQTATGLDNSVFMTMNTMKQFFSEARQQGMRFLADPEEDGVISTILVRLQSGYDPEDVAKEIRAKIGVDVIVSQSIITGVANHLESLVGFIHILTAVLWILSILVLFTVFLLTANERKKEFSILRVLGATRKKLTGIVLNESFLVSVAGSIVGVALASLVIFPFGTLIEQQLGLPYLQPELSGIIMLLVSSLILAAAVGPLASVYAAVKISQAETYLTLREGE